MHITGELTLGSVLTIVTLLGIAVTMGRKLGSFEETLKSHGGTMVDHAKRISEQEIQIRTLVSSVDRLIWQMQGTQNRSDERERGR